MLLYISLIFVMSILMAVIATASSLFPQSSAFVIFLLFFLYGVSSVSIPGLSEFTHPCGVFFPSHLILLSLLKHLEQAQHLQEQLAVGVLPMLIPFPRSAPVWAAVQVSVVTMRNTFPY